MSRLVKTIVPSAFLARATLPRSRAIEQMADDMRVLAANKGDVTEHDLELLGFTAQQISLLGRDAAQRAQALSLR